MKKVALSGAGGIVGRTLRVELHKHGVDLRSSGLEPLQPLHENEDITHGDLRDSAVVDRLLDGIDVLIHLAGTSVERPLAEIIENNLIALVQVYEGARRKKVRRVIFASSNHAFGMYPVDDKLKLDAPYRPDGFYGLSKVWGEAMSQMYWDKHGIEGISIRIGTTMNKPPDQLRQLSTWLGTEDLVQLIMQCIAVPNVGCMAVWGVSDNTRSYWDNTGAEQLGFQPKQDSEIFAADILKQPNPLHPIAQRYMGGSFVTQDFTPFEERPRHL